MAEVEEKQAKPRHDETPLRRSPRFAGCSRWDCLSSRLSFRFRDSFVVDGEGAAGWAITSGRSHRAGSARAVRAFIYYRNIRHGDIIVFYKPTLEANGEHLSW